MGRRPCCAKEGLNRGAWSAREDKILINFIKVHGEGKWRDLPQRAGLKRCGKSCRLRWLNYLRPDIKRGNISTEEEELIVRLHKLLGNRWSLIAGRLPGRTDNEIKNYWNTNLSKKVQGDKIPQCPKKKRADLVKEAKHKEKLKHEAGDNDKPHQVIRTKAVRCTKVVNILEHRPMSLGANKNVVNTPEGYLNSNGGSPSENNNSSGNIGDDDDDLLMDFDIGDLLLPESPSSNFGQPNYEMVNDREESDDKLTLDVDNYGQTDGVNVFADDTARPGPESTSDPFQQIAGFDLESMAKFLGSEEEWI